MQFPEQISLRARFVRLVATPILVVAYLGAARKMCHGISMTCSHFFSLEVGERPRRVIAEDRFHKGYSDALQFQATSLPMVFLQRLHICIEHARNIKKADAAQEHPHLSQVRHGWFRTARFC